VTIGRSSSRALKLGMVRSMTLLKRRTIQPKDGLVKVQEDQE
jgi:hypothetical protein